MLEIVGVTGVVHMGQIHSGLRTGIRIAQGGHVSNMSFEEFIPPSPRKKIERRG